MNLPGANIYRKERHDWVPLLSFGAGRTRTEADGWHSFPYNVPYIRTMGVRYKDAAANVVNHQIAYRRDGTYISYNTQSGFVCDIKYDPTKLVAIWYRYSNVDAILVPFNQMPELMVLSLREHMVNFGDLDLTGNPKMSFFEVSKGGSMNSVAFHADAPLELVYLTDCNVTTAVVDACLTQCYNNRAITSGSPNKSFLSQVVGHSAGLQYMVDELVNNYGWAVFSGHY